MGDKLSSAFISDGLDPNNMGPGTATATGTTMQTVTQPGATSTPTSTLAPRPTAPPQQPYFNVGDTAPHLPGWGIAVIVIVILVILAAGWIIHTRVRWGYWGIGLKRVELRGRNRCAECGHVTWGGTAACARCQVVRGRAPVEMVQRPEPAVARPERSSGPGTDGYYGYQARQEMRREQRAREREAAGIPPAGRDPRKNRFRNYTDTVVERMYVPFI